MAAKKKKSSAKRSAKKSKSAPKGKLTLGTLGRRVAGIESVLERSGMTSHYPLGKK